MQDTILDVGLPVKQLINLVWPNITILWYKLMVQYQKLINLIALCLIVVGCGNSSSPSLYVLWTSIVW